MAAYAQWDSIRQRGRARPGNVVTWSRDGEIVDSGLNVSALTNTIAIVEFVGTNVVASIEYKSEKNQPGGYAGLDEQGNLNASLVETIVVVFVGGEAVDVQ